MLGGHRPVRFCRWFVLVAFMVFLLMCDGVVPEEHPRQQHQQKEESKIQQSTTDAETCSSETGTCNNSASSSSSSGSPVGDYYSKRQQQLQQEYQQKQHQNQEKQQIQQQNHQQQQQQQQQQKNTGSYIVETINIEFGEPQVVLNHDGEVTKSTIQKTQAYITSYPNWISTCLNQHQLCSYWAAIGECTQNQAYMTLNCRPSCQTCPLPTKGEALSRQQQTAEKTDAGVNTKNKDLTNTPYDAYDFILVSTYHGESQRLPTVNADPVVQRISQMISYMNNHVHTEPKYEAIKELCKLKDDRCTIWAVEGECERNPTYMRVACAPVCGTCEMISYEGRCPFDKNSIPTTFGTPGEVDELFAKIVSEHGVVEGSAVEVDSATGTTTTISNNDKSGPIVTILSSPNNPANNINNHTTKGGPWIIQFDNFATDEECDQLIKLGEQVGHETSKTVGTIHPDGSHDAVMSDRVRTSTNAWCKDTCENDVIVKSLWNKIERTVHIPQNNSEFLQLLKYEESQFYKKVWELYGSIAQV